MGTSCQCLTVPLQIHIDSMYVEASKDKHVGSLINPPTTARARATHETSPRGWQLTLTKSWILETLTELNDNPSILCFAYTGVSTGAAHKGEKSPPTHTNKQHINHNP